MKKSIFVFVLLVSLVGCHSNYEEIQFLRLKDVKVKGISDGDLKVSTIAVFHNPNKFKGKLKSVNISVFYKGEKLADVEHLDRLTVKPESNFDVPLTLAVSMDKLQKGLLSNLASLLRKRSVELEFKGDIKVGTFGFSQNIPVNYKQELQF